MWKRVFNDHGVGVGVFDGLIVGIVEGTIDGNFEGIVDGKMEGNMDGVVDGNLDGRMEGVADGNVDGSIEGKKDGNVEGFHKFVNDWTDFGWVRLHGFPQFVVQTIAATSPLFESTQVASQRLAFSCGRDWKPCLVQPFSSISVMLVAN